MSIQPFSLLTALCGILSAATLVLSSVVYQGLLPASTIAQLMGRQDVDQNKGCQS
jgi:hypothetical protein